LGFLNICQLRTLLSESQKEKNEYETKLELSEFYQLSTLLIRSLTLSLLKSPISDC
jgi:hypothetical protein